ncbi:efflux RND transporter periplasmic adaptor subunit [Anatilimnocola floriformis]|uniref:efflux RND transporter periplasmic adaptor subunit n=1 Tax=Anatilimnocola floriformis TaxID=2948575 RepID=UPI0020C33D7F|nr:efflux RND transporter periplasmic adaptor subunit [Anatilimnocola floriformis]
MSTTEIETPVASHDPDEVGEVPAAPRTQFSVVALVSFFGVAILAGLFLLGWLPRVRQSAALAHEVQRVHTALPRVTVERPRLSDRFSETLLPGDIEAMQETAVYARTTGYIRTLKVDIGQSVKAGETLALLDTPEIDAQVQQMQASLVESQAALESAKATARLSETKLVRAAALVAKAAASQQELDDAEAAEAVAKARVKLAEATIDVNRANLERTTQLQSFSTITAPFAGTITTRTAEVGQLVTAGNGDTQSLFRLASTNPVRVFVNVPQIYASGVAIGLKAEILVREQPGRKFTGEVVRTARAIDPRTRTLLTEIHIPNEDQALLTGSYVQVLMTLERANPPLMVAASALIVNAKGTHVAVVGPDQLIQLRAVKIEGDTGSEVGIATGLGPQDLVVINPGDRLSQGTKVDVEVLPAAKTAAVSK